MNTAKLHVVGSAHQARFGESFDAELAAALEAAHDPDRAANELDELGLLGVLAFYAAAGHYEAEEPGRPQVWGLDPVPSDHRVRRHHFAVHYSATRVDVFVFTGIAVRPDQTIVDSIEVRPEIIA